MQEVVVGRGEKGIVEVVHDVEEFLRLVAPESRVHYELYWKAVSVFRGLIEEIEAGVVIYGLTREGFVLKCVIIDRISWQDERLRKYGNTDLHSAYNKWIKEKWEEYEKIAKELGATPGKFEFIHS
jgi:hypothetical protein